jgi:hypothetical protein
MVLTEKAGLPKYHMILGPGFFYLLYFGTIESLFKETE